MNQSSPPNLDKDRPWYLDHPIADALLLAPPGCGKTETLARWIGRLIDTDLVRPPHQILALSFSNKAKANLRNRLAGELGTQWWRHVRVMNLHGFAFHLYQHHSSVMGTEPLQRPPQRGWHERTVKQVARETRCDEADLRKSIRIAKSGAFTDDDVLARLQGSLPAALVYEQRIRDEGRVDFDDVIRLGLLTIKDSRIVDLYRARFSALVLDEIQDLSRAQFELARPIAIGRAVYAGDRAQGIYSFAGADPEWVFDQIRKAGAKEVELKSSYRSSPPVLKAVSAIGQVLGGSTVTCATPDGWGERGAVRVLRFGHAEDEAANVLERAQQWMDQHPEHAVAVIARTKGRRLWVDEELAKRNLVAEIWDFPAHRPAVVALMTNHYALGTSEGTDNAAIDDLQMRCVADVGANDLDTLDEIDEAFEMVRTLAREMALDEIISGIRLSSGPDEPVGRGLHLLNGHVGKGQEFDKVFIIGMEEAFLPHFAAMKSGDAEAIKEELAVLHVMVSRAREELEVSHCDVVPDSRGRERTREPSRWLNAIASASVEILDFRDDLTWGPPEWP